MVARIHDRPIREQACGGFPRSIDRVVDSQFDFAVVAEPAHEIDFRENAPGVLNFAPPELETAFHAEQQCLLRFCLGLGRQVLSDQFLGVIQKHAERFPAFLVLQNFTAEWIRRLSVDASDFQAPRCLRPRHDRRPA